LDGFLFIDKPCGPTSFGVVRQVRNLLGRAKVGHSGTLDPQASGLLICAVNNATRLLSLLPSEPKQYRFGVQFGKETDTLDGEGVSTASSNKIPTLQELNAALAACTGTQLQTPPRFSAIKINGRRAYELARLNKPFELKARQVRIGPLACEAYDEPAGRAECVVTCSNRTYVRSLVRDIAHALGTVAYASFIRRTAIGPFSVDSALAFDTLGPDCAAKITPVKEALAFLPSVVLDEGQRRSILMGRQMAFDTAAPAGGTVMAYADNGSVVAVLTKQVNGMHHPDKVFGGG
jgi:tRNA pseudouridine55 synthase